MEAGAQKRGPSEGVDFRAGSPQSLQPPAARPTIGTPASAARSRTQLCRGLQGTVAIFPIVGYWGALL